MNQIGSRFYKDMSTYDISNNRFRRKIMTASIILAIGVGVAMFWFKLPDILTYIVVVIVLTPGTIVGLKKDVELKEKWSYSLEIQERVYQAQETEGYKTSDFIKRKGVSEIYSTNAK